MLRGRNVLQSFIREYIFFSFCYFPILSQIVKDCKMRKTQKVIRVIVESGNPNNKIHIFTTRSEEKKKKNHNQPNYSYKYELFLSELECILLFFDDII